MNKIFRIVFVSVALFAMTACETNNVFDDLGSSDGSIVANVYLEVLAPKLQAGISRDLEVQYWSTDDDFTYLGLWDYVSLAQVFTATVDGVSYEVSESDEFQDWTEYQQYSFDFADWNPEISAYIRTVQYEISTDYDQVTLSSSDISINDFIAQVPEGFLDDMYTYYSTNLTRTTLNDLMVDNSVMTQTEFDSHYAESGFLTADGKTAIISGLQQIGAATLIGNEFTIGNEYTVTVAFRATNGTEKSNESRRSFVVF